MLSEVTVGSAHVAHADSDEHTDPVRRLYDLLDNLQTQYSHWINGNVTVGGQ